MLAKQLPVTSARISIEPTLCATVGKRERSGRACS
jgi:hypothetical protein